MQSLLLIVMVLRAGLQAVVDLAHALRTRRRFTILTLRWVAVFFVYGAIGVAVMLPLFDAQTALAAALFYLFWVFEGVLWLVRKAPRLRALPRWIGMKPNLLDAVFVGGVMVCLAIGIAGRSGPGQIAAQSQAHPLAH